MHGCLRHSVPGGCGFDALLQALDSFVNLEALYRRTPPTSSGTKIASNGCTAAVPLAGECGHETTGELSGCLAVIWMPSSTAKCLRQVRISLLTAQGEAMSGRALAGR